MRAPNGLYKLITIPKSKIRCPYLAIPIPGERPFVVLREQFEAVTRDINVTDSSLEKINITENGRLIREGVWTLTITHRTGKVRGRIRFYSLVSGMSHHQYYYFKETIAKWAAGQRKKRAMKPASKFDKQIAKLERELKKIYLHRPHNPLVSNEWGKRRDESARKAEQFWRGQKMERKKIAFVAGRVLRSHITDRTAYQVLREAGYAVKMVSQLNTAEREQLRNGGREDYWKQLYRFCLPCPYWPYTRDRVLYHRKDWNLTERLESHAKARLEYLAAAAEVASLRAQIAAIQQLASITPLATETGLVAV